MRFALREIPHVANFELCKLVLAIFIDSRDKDGPGVDVTPFSLYKCQLSTNLYG